MVDELLFSGQLIAVTMEETDDFRLQINNEAISFLQQLVEPILVVSFHGPKKSGKSALVHSLLQLEQESMTECSGVWLYIKRANYPNAKYLAVLDRPGFGTEKQVDRVLYSILSGLSSVVVHHVNGQLTSDSVDHFSFLAGNAEGSDVPLAYDFPQSPRLLWVLQNVTTAKIKEKVQESGLSLQQIEQTYMCNALAALTDDSPSARAIKLFEAIYSNSRCFPVPPKETEAFKSRVEKLLRVLTDPIHNIYHKNVVFNGPLAGFVLVTMLSCRDNVFATFKGQIWDNLIDNCCLRVVEDAVKLYKLRMSQKLSSIVNISDPKESKQLLTANQDCQAAVQKCQKSIEVPCESGVLYCKHSIAKREAKKNLRAIPVQSESRRTFFQKMFRNLVESEFATFQEKNECMSSELCHSLLATLHTKMTENVNAQSMVGPMDDENGYCVQSAEFKRFYLHYQVHLMELMTGFTDQAKGPMQKRELAKFIHDTIRPQLAELSIKLDTIREHENEVLKNMIRDREEQFEEFIAKQKLYKKQTADAQDTVNRQLADVAKLQALRKEALVGAINDLTEMHTMATEQKELLEEAAFVSVQLPEQKVIEAAAQEKKVTELQGYLVKQGGGGNVLNPLGRKNWKQRYFILNGPNLIYAKSKDDYERGKIIKELCLTGCKIDPSRDAGEGFDITPGKSAHVFELQRGLFEKNSKKRSSAADSGRIFKLRTQNIQERDVWIDKLRQAAGGY